MFDFKNIFLLIFKKNKTISHILMFFAVFLTFSTLFAVNLKTNYGQVRFFTLLSFFLAFSLQRFFVTNFLANPIAKCYNKIKGRRNERKIKKNEHV
ncbi:MAG: hypothetical protein J6K39_03790 [Clostridia bacterium]|nr:hypothetical protein [Clostridia bacterium]